MPLRPPMDRCRRALAAFGEKQLFSAGQKNARAYQRECRITCIQSLLHAHSGFRTGRLHASQALARPGTRGQSLHPARGLVDKVTSPDTSKEKAPNPHASLWQLPVFSQAGLASRDLQACRMRRQKPADAGRHAECSGGCMSLACMRIEKALCMQPCSRIP